MKNSNFKVDALIPVIQLLNRSFHLYYFHQNLIRNYHYQHKYQVLERNVLICEINNFERIANLPKPPVNEVNADFDTV